MSVVSIQRSCVGWYMYCFNVFQAIGCINIYIVHFISMAMICNLGLVKWPVVYCTSSVGSGVHVGTVVEGGLPLQT